MGGSWTKGKIEENFWLSREELSWRQRIEVPSFSDICLSQCLAAGQAWLLMVHCWVSFSFNQATLLMVSAEGLWATHVLCWKYDVSKWKMMQWN